jgi:hypothetical protein
MGTRTEFAFKAENGLLRIGDEAQGRAFRPKTGRRKPEACGFFLRYFKWGHDLGNKIVWQIGSVYRKKRSII